MAHVRFRFVAALRGVEIRRHRHDAQSRRGTRSTQHHGQLDPSRYPGDGPAFGGGSPILQPAGPDGGEDLGVVQEPHSACSFPNAEGHRRDGCFPSLRGGRSRSRGVGRARIAERSGGERPGLRLSR